MKGHPAPILVWAAALGVASFLTGDPVVLAALAAGALAVVRAERAGAAWRAHMRIALASAVVFLLLNPFLPLGPGQTLWRSDFLLPVFGRLQVTIESLSFALAMGLRMALVLTAFAVLSRALDADALAGALAARLRPTAVLPFALAARFLPVLSSDARAIADAQRTRGVAWDRGPFLARARAAGALAMPLLETSLDRAARLAEAMEARGFGAGPRTRWRPVRLGRRDAARACMAVLPALALAAGPWAALAAAAGSLPFAALARGRTSVEEAP